MPRVDSAILRCRKTFRRRDVNAASSTFPYNRTSPPNDESRSRLQELVRNRHELETSLTQQIGLQQMIRKDWVRIQRSITRGLSAGSQIILEEFQSKAVSNISFSPPFKKASAQKSPGTVQIVGIHDRL